MTITGGSGISIDLTTGVSRAWYIGHGGIKHWVDNEQPCDQAGTVKDSLTVVGEREEQQEVVK